LKPGDIIHAYPGDIVTVAGSKKKIPATFSRPWQSRVPYPNPKCPFHKAEERETALRTTTDASGEKWFVIDSLFAPENPHRLIIPDLCWDDEQMRVLGGLGKIRTAFCLAAEQLASEDDRDKLWGFAIQIGPLAAQNVPHCHYHLYRPTLFRTFDGVIEDDPNPAATVFNFWEYTDLVVFENDSFKVTAGGQYTGQLLIKPKQPVIFTNDVAATSLADMMHHFVELYAKKFKSAEGLGPDYRFEFEIHGGAVNFGIFVPKLNNTGTLEDMADIDRRRGRNLLWSHEETARYLRSE
jgi:hypothetical protein